MHETGNTKNARTEELRFAGQWLRDAWRDGSYDFAGISMTNALTMLEPLRLPR
jgi:hypothetical protein